MKTLYLNCAMGAAGDMLAVYGHDRGGGEPCPRRARHGDPRPRGWHHGCAGGCLGGELAAAQAGAAADHRLAGLRGRSGQVRCARGILPVPNPATACLLQGIPAYSGTIQTELCTPTGAALLKHFVSRFGDMPVITTQAIGYGMGTKEFDAADCICAFWGAAAEYWYKSEELISLVKILCVARQRVWEPEPDTVLKMREWQKILIQIIHAHIPAISSSEIRSRLRKGLPISSYVPKPVEKYIRDNSLYQKNFSL